MREMMCCIDSKLRNDKLDLLSQLGLLEMRGRD